MQTIQEKMLNALDSNEVESIEGGLRFPSLGVSATGEYFGRVNGGAWEKMGDNLITTEGFAHILNVALGGKAKSAGYFLALFSGSATPQANWTASNFASVASEIVSMTEGYTGATRPQWTPIDTVNGSIDNFASAAKLTIATSSELNVTGAAILTTSTKGGTTGVLISASKYAAQRSLQDGDTFEIGYRLSLTAS